MVNGTTLSLDEGLLNNYFATGNTSQGTPNTTQVVRVPHYSTLNVPGGTTLTASTFNSSSRLGGILVFRADSITVDGTINGNSLGFPGGVTNTTGSGVHLGTQGWSYTGQGFEQTTTANAGGGSGGPRSSSRRYGGAGGGYGTNGIRGQDPNGAFGGQGGLAHGDPLLSRIYLGSGGGSGAQSSGTVGVGGKGGGLVYIGTNSANVSGIISANGQNGGNSGGFSVAGSGGGSGGSLYLSAASSTISGSVTASGGTGGSSGSSNGGPGGNGGAGRIYQPATATDLTITAITGPTSAARGDTISVLTTVANVQAVATATTFKVGIYLSTDSTITTADTLIGECTLTGGLAGNTSSALTTGSSPECGNAVVPSDLYTVGGPLTYYLGAIADYEGVVPELTEINNAMVQTGVSGPEGTSVSVVTNSLASTDNNGGGTFGLIELMLGLGGLGMALRRRR